MQKKTYLYISSGIFLIVSLIHLAKILTGFEIRIFGISYPILFSWVEMIIGFYLAFIGFRLSNRK